MGTRKKSRKNRSRRAVSPVIATVILVAIAITVSVAVAYWMGGIAGQYTQFEQIEIQSAICYKEIPPIATDYYWNVTMTLKNTGTQDATMISAFINEQEVDVYGQDDTFDGSNAVWATSMNTTTYITSGDSQIVFFYIANDKPDTTLSSGTTVNIKIHSSGGMDYPKLIELV
jgi:flagellin-like protein